MFAARGIAISFSVFVMVYCVLSVTVSCVWRRLWQASHGHAAGRIADLLFALRMLPLVTAVVITAAFTVPSFLLLEPRAVDEPVGGLTLALGTMGALLGLFGIANAILALRRVARAIATWTRGAQPVEFSAAVPFLRISPTVPAMTAIGIIRPRILLSRAAEFQLTGSELQSALNHELAHVRRGDNLKKLLLRFAAFPGMRGLETAWLEATEMAADDAAVSTTVEALDLAAALIKLSRFTPAGLSMDLTVALVQGPVAVVHARVRRLIAWSAERRMSRGYSPRYGVAAALVTVAVLALTYSHLLVHVHTATEWLIR
jgi:Zn-dependent protease with chaperone function